MVLTTYRQITAKKIVAGQTVDLSEVMPHDETYDASCHIEGGSFECPRSFGDQIGVTIRQVFNHSQRSFRPQNHRGGGQPIGQHWPMAQPLWHWLIQGRNNRPADRGCGADSNPG